MRGRERGSEKAAASNRQQRRRRRSTSMLTTNLSKQLFIRVFFNAKKARTTNNNESNESNVFVCCCDGQKAAAMRRALAKARAFMSGDDPYSLRATWRDLWLDACCGVAKLQLNLCGLPSVFIICIWMEIACGRGKTDNKTEITKAAPKHTLNTVHWPIKA